jgi:hypothetical protein
MGVVDMAAAAGAVRRMAAGAAVTGTAAEVADLAGAEAAEEDAAAAVYGLAPSRSANSRLVNTGYRTGVATRARVSASRLRGRRVAIPDSCIRQIISYC